MHFKLEKSEIFSSVYSQIALIILIFIILIASVLIFISKNENRHMEEKIKNTFMLAESRIVSAVLESESFLINYSESIRSMILRAGNRSETGFIRELSVYIAEIKQIIQNDNRFALDILNIYGYFYLQEEGVFISGAGTEFIIGYETDALPWIVPSIEASGNTVVSNPFRDPVLLVNLITISRCITDDGGNILGIICIDATINNIYNDIIYNNLTGHSYGILFTKDLSVIAHPVYHLTGDSLDTADYYISYLARNYLNGLSVFKQKTKNYASENVFVFFHKIAYDLVLGIVIPVSEYNLRIFYYLIFLIIVCGILAAVLCLMMRHIAQAKLKSDMLNKQKSSFLATMSHEIRTPLNAIIGMTEIEMQVKKHPSSAIETFEKINHSGNLLLNIINDILDLSKIEAGKLELIPVKYEVAGLLNDVIQLNYIRYEHKHIEFIVNVNENIPLLLIGDELRIKQILNNLLSNAFKYTDVGYIKFNAEAECVGKGGIVLVTLIFRITDTGQGMSQDQLNKLFDEYSRFNMEANRTTEGSGLGMTITQNLINLMQGKITIKSTAGEGTDILVRIPQRTEGIGISGIIGKELAENFKLFRRGSAINTRKTQIKYEYMPYGRVLIVDDVETNLYVAKGLMLPYGLKIDMAESGFEAIEKIKAGNIYDIIFMDHMMPKMDGIEAAKKIRETGYKHPIVALTANALTGHEELFIENGFDGFIAKPIDIRQLNVLLNKLIRNKQPEEAIKAANKESTEYEIQYSKDANRQIDDKLAAIFIRDAEKAYSIIENILKNNFKDNGDLQMYIINIHGLKSALANIGETELSQEAQRLEQAGRNKEIRSVSSETKMFLDNLKEVIEKIKPRENTNEPSEDSEDSLIFLHEKLKIIAEACESYDKKTIKNILIELRQRSWSHKISRILNLMDEYLLHSDFPGIFNLAKDNQE